MLTLLQQEKQTHFFRLIDVDGNHFMEPDDWVTIGQRLASERGIKEGSDEYAQIQKATEGIWKELSPYVSSKHPGKATLEEWMKFVDEKIINVDEKLYDQYVNRVVKGLFDILDINNNDVIDAWEYILFLKCFGISDGAAHAAFTALDWNGDGVIDETEMVKSVQIFFKSDEPGNRGNSLLGPLDWFT